MKNYVLLFVSLFSFNLVFSQNWSLFNTNEHYHYQHVDDEIPLNTVFVDSITIEGYDTVYYFNRLFLECDTCAFDTTALGDTLFYYLDNQPTFLQREIKYYQGSSTVVLRNPETYTLPLIYTAPEEWWFDADETLKASVYDFDEIEVFGKRDSVITYAINGEPKIKLSKTYGFIKYFDYELVGLEKDQLGNCLPGMKAFFDFEEGDEFQYKKVINPGHDLAPIYAISKLRIGTIEEKDSVIEIYRSGKAYYYYDDDINNAAYVEDHVLPISIDLSENYYPDMKMMVNGLAGPSFASEDVYSVLTYEKVNDTVSMTIGTDLDATIVDRFSNIYIENGEELYSPISDSRWLTYKYTPGLGLVFRGYFDGSEYFKRELQGYVKDGDTTGVVYADEFFVIEDTTGIKIGKEVVDASIFPNPSTGQFSVDIGTNQQATVEFYNLQGQLIKSFVAENKQSYDLSNFRAGVYIIKVNTKNEAQQLKWIKQ